MFFFFFFLSRQVHLVMIYRKLNKIISCGLKKKDAIREGEGFGALLLPAVNQPVKSSAGIRLGA